MLLPIDQAVLEAGKAALPLVQRFLSGRVTRQDLSAGLAGIGVDKIISENWLELTSDPRYVPHWQILQTLKGLIEELDYQFCEYGESTMYEDMKDIALNLKRIADLD